MDEILDNQEQRIENVAQYIKSVMQTGMVNDNQMAQQLSHLKFCSTPFEFLGTDLRPAHYLLERMIQKRPQWNLDAHYLIKDTEHLFTIDKLPECITSHCITYSALKAFLGVYLRSGRPLCASITFWMGDVCTGVVCRCLRFECVP